MGVDGPFAPKPSRPTCHVRFHLDMDTDPESFVAFLKDTPDGTPKVLQFRRVPDPDVRKGGQSDQMWSLTPGE